MANQMPVTEMADSVYSNYDHELDAKVVAELEAAPDALRAHHAAWDFSGQIWKGVDGRWHELVWRYGVEVKVLEGETIADVIKMANAEYGSK